MVAVRGQYLHCIAYPPQWELKRGLADRYAKLGVYGSAAEAYLELEQWDEVVQCYRALDRLGRAEAIVRERLQVRGRGTHRPQRHRREGGLRLWSLALAVSSDPRQCWPFWCC